MNSWAYNSLNSFESGWGISRFWRGQNRSRKYGVCSRNINNRGQGFCTCFARPTSSPSPKRASVPFCGRHLPYSRAFFLAAASLLLTLPPRATLPPVLCFRRRLLSNHSKKPEEEEKESCAGESDQGERGDGGAPRGWATGGGRRRHGGARWLANRLRPGAHGWGEQANACSH